MLPEKNGGWPIDEQNRLKVLKTYFFDFKQLLEDKEQKTITYCEDADEIVCALYYRYAKEIVRDNIDSRIIQNFKIISGTEMAILLAMPIIHTDHNKQKYFNARLAIYSALRFLIEWNDEYLIPEKCHKIFLEDKEIKSFLDEHYKWLFFLNPTYYNPIFSNSHVWRLFYYLLRDKSMEVK